MFRGNGNPFPLFLCSASRVGRPLLIGSAHVVCRGSPRFNPFYSSWICSRAGEIRGGEAFDLLQLLNTGHNGTISTVHANSAAQGISRFTSCVLQSGVEMPYLAIKTNIADSLNIIVQIERRPGARFVSEVLEVRGYELEADRYDLYQVYGQSWENAGYEVRGVD